MNNKVTVIFEDHYVDNRCAIYDADKINKKNMVKEIKPLTKRGRITRFFVFYLSFLFRLVIKHFI